MLLGLIPEPPFAARSWSGSSAPFFSALRSRLMLESAHHVALSPARRLFEQARVFEMPMARWRENYHASVPCMRAMSDAAGALIRENKDKFSAVLQIGAWFCAAAENAWTPTFSYHDGNAAMWYRFYGRGLLSDARRAEHLRYEQFTYRRTQGIFVMSSWLASSFVNDFGIPADKVHVIGAGVNLSRVPSKPLEHHWDEPCFMMVGKDFERKGGKYLLAAFRKVRKTVPHARLVLVGPSLELDEPGVTSTGFLDKSDPQALANLTQLFARATCIVLPSIYEPFGISLCEGMIHALPCIAVNRCAMPEIVKHRETGLIAEAENADALAEAMIELASNPQQARAYGNAGFTRARRNFTWSAVTGKMHDVLSDQYGLLKDESRMHLTA